MSTLIEDLARASYDEGVPYDTRRLLWLAADHIKDLVTARSRAHEDKVANMQAVIDGLLSEDPLPAHKPLVTPVDPRSDCSLTPWCVRT